MTDNEFEVRLPEIPAEICAACAETLVYHPVAELALMYCWHATTGATSIRGGPWKLYRLDPLSFHCVADRAVERALSRIPRQ